MYDLKKTERFSSFTTFFLLLREGGDVSRRRAHPTLLRCFYGIMFDDEAFEEMTDIAWLCMSLHEEGGAREITRALVSSSGQDLRHRAAERSGHCFTCVFDNGILGIVTKNGSLLGKCCSAATRILNFTVPNSQSPSTLSIMKVTEVKGGFTP